MHQTSFYLYICHKHYSSKKCDHHQIPVFFYNYQNINPHYLKIIFENMKLIRSFVAAANLELEISEILIIALDFSPTDTALSPQLFRLIFSKILSKR